MAGSRTCSWCGVAGHDTRSCAVPRNAGACSVCTFHGHDKRNCPPQVGHASPTLPAESSGCDSSRQGRMLRQRRLLTRLLRADPGVVQECIAFRYVPPGLPGSNLLVASERAAPAAPEEDPMAKDADRKKAVRALMLETGTNYTTALRVWQVDADARRAARDATAALELPEPGGQQPPHAPGSPDSGALEVRFSHSPTGADTDPDRPE